MGKKTIVGVIVEQLSKWVFEKVQEKSQMHKMESVQRKKKKKRGNGEGCTREKDEKEENEISPTNIMIMLQNLLLFLQKNKEDLIFRVGNWDCRTGRG